VFPDQTCETLLFDPALYGGRLAVPMGNCGRAVMSVDIRAEYLMMIESQTRLAGAGWATCDRECPWAYFAVDRSRHSVSGADKGKPWCTEKNVFRIGRHAVSAYCDQVRIVPERFHS